MGWYDSTLGIMHKGVKKGNGNNSSSLPPAPPWPDQKEEDGDRGRKFEGWLPEVCCPKSSKSG